MADERCLLTVHAHPDDESSKGPATVARYHAEGVRTVLVCCTGGEAGDILNPAMDTDEVKARLPEVRRQELERAASIIGYDEVVMLGYRDSGMPGSETNGHPDAFAAAPLEEAVERLVAVVRRVRPQVVVTYPKDQSEYPHPDHLRAQEVATAAFEAAGRSERFPSSGAPFAPSKLYATTWPASRMLEMHQKFLDLGLPSPFDDKWLERLRRRRQETWTTRIDVSGYTDVRQEALRAHATQVDPTSAWWFGLPPEVMRSIHPFDEYRLLESTVGEASQESDLFERVPVGVTSQP